MQQCMYGTKICGIYDLQKCLTQSWVDFELNVIEAAIDQWRDSLRSCMRAGGGHFEHMLRNYLWSPYGIGRPYIFSCCGLFFFLLFFPRLISAAADWMSAILPHMVWP